jgi:hypothetical protein
MPAPDLQPFVVTGCARSGTTYIAAVLSGLGLRCGHEVVFGPRSRSFAGFGDQHGDCSWLAAPFLSETAGAIVFHQVRHPVKVVRSLLGVRFFAERGPVFLRGDDLYTRLKWRVREQLAAAGHVEPSAKLHRPHLVYRAFLHEYAPEVWEPDTESERALGYWLTWTWMIRSLKDAPRNPAHHVEQLDAARIAAMLQTVGLDVSEGHVALAMEKVPTDLNSRRVAPLEWSDLPDTKLRREAEELAEELGYAVHDPGRAPREITA